MRNRAAAAALVACCLVAPARADELDPAWIGTWRSSAPDPNDKKVTWTSTFTVEQDGSARLEVTNGTFSFPTTEMRFEAHGGNFKATPTVGEANSGVYEAKGDQMVVTDKKGVKVVWTRVAGSKPAPDAKPGPPLIDTRPADERLLSASPASMKAAAPAGLGDFLAGLDALVALDGKTALAALDKAVAADDASALYHRLRAVTLLCYEKPAEAHAEIERASRLAADKLDTHLDWLAKRIAGGNPDSIGTPQNDIEDRIYETGMAYFAASREAPERKEAALGRARAKCRELVRAFADLERQRGGPVVVRALFARAQDRLAKGDAAGALDDLRPALATWPEDPLALLLHARCSLALGALEPARAELTRILTVATDHGPSYALRAIAHARLGAAERARADLELAAKLAPEDAKAARPLVEKALAEPTGDLAAASAALASAASEGAPEAALVEKAVSLVRASHAVRKRLDESYQDQLRVLEAAVRAEPRNPDRVAALGLFLFNASQDPHWERVELDGPGRSYRYTTQRSEAEERRRAERCADLALSVNPDHVRAIAVKARCRLYELQWSDAETLIRHGLELAPRDPDLLESLVQVLGVAAFQRGADASDLRSIKTWEDARYIYTHYPSPAELAQADELDRQAAAIRKLADSRIDQLVAQKASSAQDAHCQGMMHAYRKELDAARASFAQAIEKEPRWLEPRLELARVLARQGQQAAAFQESVAAVNLVETTAAPLLQLAAAQIARTDWKAAKDAVARASALDPADPRVWTYAGIVLAATKDAAGAAAHFRAALAVHEAVLRASGESLGPDGRFAVEAAGFAAAVRLRLAGVLAKPEERAAALAPLLDLEPRLRWMKPGTRAFSAQLPDPALGPEARPEVPALSVSLAWARLVGGANLAEVDGKADEAARLLLPLRPYDPGRREPEPWREIAARPDATQQAVAGLILARLAWKKGDRAAARELFERSHRNRDALKSPLVERERQAYLALDAEMRAKAR